MAQREQVFKKSKEEVKKLAVDGAELLKTLAAETDGNFTFEYSPESFPGTEVDYAVEVCNAVLDVWKPDAEHKAIINIPTTVQIAMPHVFACQIEYIHKHLKYRDNVVLSVHPHNDRGCGISDAEFGILAGADRVEGTLFGNGERTGNVDIVTLAMNMVCHGVDPKLDFSKISEIREKYERFTGMRVYERTPYVRRSGIYRIFRFPSGCHLQGYGVERSGQERRPLGCAVPAAGSEGCRKGIRVGCHPHQQPVRQGRSRIRIKAELGMDLPDKDGRKKSVIWSRVYRIADIRNSRRKQFTGFLKNIMSKPVRCFSDFRVSFRAEGRHHITPGDRAQQGAPHD